MQNKNHKLFSIRISYNYHKSIESPYSMNDKTVTFGKIYIMEFECFHAVDSLYYFGLKGCLCRNVVIVQLIEGQGSRINGAHTQFQWTFSWTRHDTTLHFSVESSTKGEENEHQQKQMNTMAWHRKHVVRIDKKRIKIKQKVLAEHSLH